MPLHMRAWEHAVKSQTGLWEFDYLFSMKGKPDKEIVEIYNAHFGLSIGIRETLEKKDEYFRNHGDELKPVEPVLAIAVRYRGILPMAVASGGTRKSVVFQLEALSIKEFFTVILTADDGIKPKPDPDIFLEASARLGVPPRQCQVFEDGELGLEAARKAGMFVTDVR